MTTAMTTKEIEMLKRKKELENLMVKSSLESEEYKDIINYFK